MIGKQKPQPNSWGYVLFQTSQVLKTCEVFTYIEIILNSKPHPKFHRLSGTEPLHQTLFPIWQLQRLPNSYQ